MVPALVELTVGEENYKLKRKTSKSDIESTVCWVVLRGLPGVIRWATDQAWLSRTGRLTQSASLLTNSTTSAFTSRIMGESTESHILSEVHPKN